MVDERVSEDKDNKNPPAERLVITLDDLNELPPDLPGQQRVYPGLSGDQSSPGAAKKAVIVGGLGGSQAWQNLVAGLIGGGVAWVIAELIFGFYRQQSSLPVLLHVSLWAAVISAAIGGILGAADGVTGGVRQKAVRGGLIGIGVGLVGGFVGGLLAQLVYGFMGGGARAGGMGQQILARTVGWGLAGLFIGLAQGVPGLRAQKVLNGLLGGLIGGGIGGIGFDVIGSIAQGGTVSRLFGLIAMGGGIGAAIGLIEEVRKDAWLRVLEGPQAGKQFIIYGEVTRIGSSPKCDIVLVKDPAIASEHCRILASRGRFTLQVSPGGLVTVNGRMMSGGGLRRGDTLRMGQSTLVFEERTMAVSPPAGVIAK